MDKKTSIENILTEHLSAINISLQEIRNGLERVATVLDKIEKTGIASYVISDGD